jgi:ABC-type lipoprotein export system ATPase subunit
VTKTYREGAGGEVIALQIADSTLRIEAGVNAIVGPSGGGKSTLLGLLGGLDVPTRGGITFEGVPLPGAEGPELRRHRGAHVAFIFQVLNLVTHLSALDNVALPLLIRGVRRARARARARRLLARVGLTDDQMGRPPAALSGGQQQRVAVARAFATKGKVILADEPTGSLDPANSETVMRLFRKLVDQTHRPVVLVTHNEELARRYADRLIHLLPGGGYRVEELPRAGKAAPRPQAGRAAPSPTPHLSLRTRLWYAVSDLRHRRLSAGITTLTIAVAACYALLLGICAQRIHHTQSRALNTADFTHVIAQAPTEELRFTAERVRRLAEEVKAETAYPCLQLNAQVSLDGKDRAQMTPVCAVVPGDPRLAAEHLAWGRPVAGAAEVVLGRRLLERLEGSLAADGPTPSSLTVEVKRKLDHREQVERLTLRIVGVLANDRQEQAHVPLEVAARLDFWCQGKLLELDGAGDADRALTFPHALAYAPVAQRDRVAEELKGYHLAGEQAGELTVLEARDPVWAALTGGAGEAKAVQALRRLDGVRVVNVYRAQAGGRSFVAWGPRDPRWDLVRDPHKHDLGWVGLRGDGPLPDYAYRLPEDAPEVPSGLTTLDTLRWLCFGPDDLFRELASDGPSADLPASVRRGAEVQFADAATFASAVKLLEGSGTGLKALTPLHARRLVRYRVRDEKVKGGAVTGEVVRLLNALPPTFETAVAHAPMVVHVAAADRMLAGTDGTDPERFAAALTAGRWPAGADGRQAAVPAAWALRRGWKLGDSIHLKLPRDEAGRGETIAVRLKLVGLTASEQGYVPHSLVRDVRLWQARRLEFDEVRQDFRSPLEVGRAAGYRRCNLFARGSAEVEGLVGRLRALGYETEDHLAEQAKLRELGRVLLGVVIFFASGCVIIAAVTVGLTTMVNIQAKCWEIGILRSLGVSSRDVLSVFLLQGLLMAAAGFGLALVIYVACEGWFRRAAAQALGIRDPALAEGWCLQPGLLWLPAVVGLVCVAFTLLGIWLPARRASGLMPAEALRRRE